VEGFGVDKLILILVIVLVLFGARRVPEIGASIGKGIRELKRGLSDATGDTDRADAAPAPRGSAATTDRADANPGPEPKRLLGRHPPE
jgi:sec-independent protein translocase protein TatA